VTTPKDRSALSPQIRGAAHDIRQMLAVIRGRTSLLLEGEHSDSLLAHLRAMDLAAADAARILDRMEGMGEAVTDRIPVSLADLVRQSLELILPPQGGWSGQGKWGAEVDLPEDVAVGVAPQIMREVLNNLLTNALAVMTGGGSVVFGLERRAERVLLLVRDSGPGVPAPLVDKIFTPGFSTSSQQGKGLGLHNCRTLLQKYGARLTLEQQPGQGACFVLDLPAVPLQPRDAVVPGEEFLDSPVPSLAGQLLVVDDEPAVLEMLKDLLGTLGFSPVLAADGNQALAAFQPGVFDLVLLDQSLPGKSGLEIAEQMRNLDPRVALILVTGWGNDDILASATDRGVDLTEKKPLTVGKIRHLLALAGGLLDKRKGQD
jgi:two-component system cell cycle sensor histidine kinase/response regulator CckA